ncbi:MoaD/ThiS family protein [Planctomicrobium sp. SH661]|uniref:MoaD/ThiS family protein n=1 Tax=Planctomicrobium sp. SH661 TaxID=3448124 RepID=UPI003F5C6BF6
MPRIHFTSNLQKHLDCPPQQVDAPTLKAALEAVFQENPRLRSYLLDDQGSLRKHVMIFVDQAMVRDRKSLSDPIHAESEVYVMQALSGG